MYGISRDGAKLVGWATLPVPFATFAVILRFASRKSAKKIGPDDWCMLLALILYYGLYISLITWAPIGKVGFPQQDLSYEQIVKFLKVERPAGISAKRSLADDFKDILLCIDLLRMGWSSYQNVVSPPLSKNLRGQMVHAFTLIVATLVMIWCISFTLTVIFRVPAGRILLATSIAAALRRLTEVLLGEWYIRPPSRCENPVSAHSYDMEATNVDEKQDLSNMCLCA